MNAPEDLPASLGPERVLRSYGLEGASAVAVSSKAGRAVWRVTGCAGTFALKALRYSARRMLFLAAAHDYLCRATDLVPRLVPTQAGQLFADDGLTRYVLSEWVYGREADLTAPSDVAAVAETLSRFHMAARPFRAPEGSSPRVYLGRWPADYAAKVGLLEQLEAIARWTGNATADQAFLEALPTLRRWIDVALDAFDRWVYEDWCEEIRARGGLCHQDFARSNLVVGSGGVKVLDLDAMAVDIPARDLRKLLNRVFMASGSWDPALFWAASRAYSPLSDLTERQWLVVLADLTFPHVAVRAACARYLPRRRPKPLVLLTRRLERAISVELSKPADLCAGHWRIH